MGNGYLNIPFTLLYEQEELNESLILTGKIFQNLIERP